MPFKVSDWQSFLQGSLTFITTRHSFLKFGNIRKVMSYLSTLSMIPCHKNVVFLLLNSYWFHQWPGFHKPKQVPWLLIWLWKVWCLSQKIGSVHVLDRPKCLGAKMLTRCHLSQLYCSQIFNSVFFNLFLFFS